MIRVLFAVFLLPIWVNAQLVRTRIQETNTSGFTASLGDDGIITIVCYGPHDLSTGLDHGDNLGHWLVNLPASYVFTVKIHANSIDLDPDPRIGVYEDDTTHAVLEFGDYRIESPNVKVTVFAGFSSFGPVDGFQFGSDEEFTDPYGMTTPEYQMYSLQVSPVQVSKQTDELLNFILPENHDPHKWADTYTKDDGFAEQVPEPHWGVLFGIGCIVIASTRSKLNR